jgi:hypothetical protein
MTTSDQTGAFRRRAAAGLLASLCLLAGCVEPPPEPRSAEEERLRSLFIEARRLDDEGRHHEALVRYETILARHPEWSSTRLNAAMAAYDSGQYVKAAEHFEFMHQLAPKDWYIIRKIIQCRERLGDRMAVDRWRDLLADMRRRKDGGVILKTHAGFARDYLPVQDMHLIGYEFFDPEQHGRHWLFRLEDRERRPVTTFLVEKSPFTARDQQPIFHVREHSPGWLRVWHVGPEGSDYDWSRALVRECLSGKRLPLAVKPLPGGARPFETPGEEAPKK